MRSWRYGLTAAVCVLLGTGVATEARAQSDVDRATARSLGEDGAKALDAKDYKGAEDAFRKADGIIHAPTLLLGLARALAGEGKLLEAQEAYKRIVREGVPPGSPPAFQKAVEDAGKEVQDISPRVGSVTISVTGHGGEAVQGVQVTWDGAPVNVATLGVRRPADPGTHVVHASADGYKAADLKVEVPTAGTVAAPLTLEKDLSAPATPAAATVATTPPATTAGPLPAPHDQAPAPASGPGPWPWVAFGVGGAGLVAGTVTGILAMSKRSSVVGNCSGGVCSPSYKGDVDSYNTLGLVSTVGFVVAGAGAAAGVILLVLKPKADPAASSAGLHVLPVVGPGSLGAVGTF